MLRDVALLGLLALIGLSCVGGGSPSNTGADSVGETAMASTESSTESTTTPGTSVGSTSDSESSTDSESGSGTETETDTGTDTETSTETDTETSTETDTETETGMEGPPPYLDVLAIVDVNPNSDTYNQKVIPLDYQGQLSGWYFGHAT
jgi:hypothetical protein